MCMARAWVDFWEEWGAWAPLNATNWDFAT